MSDDKRYWGGSSVSGRVRQLKATSFKELVERYFNVPVTKKFSRREFHTYDKDTRDKAKDGPFVCASVFKEEGCKRNNQNCIALSLALLDFDSVSASDEAEGFVPYGQRLFDSPDFIKDALYPFNCVAYETISSKKGDRRIRILVDLEEMPVELHKPVIIMLAKRLGVELRRWKGKVESMTLSLPMFRPVEFLGEDYGAVICSRTDGREVEELDVPQDEEIDEETGERSYSYIGKDDLEMAYLPVVGITVSDVAAVLEHIDPDDYHVWLMTIMAMRHQFRGEEEAKEAFDTVDDWSSSSAKYVDSDDVFAKWDSCQPDATGRAPVTIRSVFEKAKQNGWDPTTLSKKIKRNIKKWIERCTDPDELMLKGPARIAAIPFKNEVTEEALCLAVTKRVEELSQTKISKVTVRKAVRSQRRQKLLAEDDDMPAWMRPWVYITTRDVFVHMGTGIELSPAAFDRTFSKELMSLAPDSDSAMTGRPTILPSHFALNVKDLKRVEGVTYDPRYGAEEPFFEHNGRLYLNEFRPSTLPRCNPELSEKAGRIWLHHVKLVIGPKYWRIIVDFCAHTVQHPGVIVRWAPLLQSAQGAGKNLIFNAVGHALGYDANYKVIKAKQVLSDFNEWVSGACLIVLNEIKIPGHSKAELTNELKDMITDDTVSVNQKFQDLRVCVNVANKVALTNWHDALHIEDTDRRWMPIKSPLQSAAECQRLSDKKHYERFVKLYKHGGALRQFLLDWEISPDFPVNGPAPKTEFRAEMIGESKNPLHEEIEDLVEDPEIKLVADDVIFTPSLMTRLTKTANNFKPSHFLRRMGYDLWKQGQKFRLNGTRGTIWFNHEKWDKDYGSPYEILQERSHGDEEIEL